MSADSPDKKKFKESDVSIDKEVAEQLAKLRKEELEKFNAFLESLSDHDRRVFMGEILFDKDRFLSDFTNFLDSKFKRLQLGCRKARKDYTPENLLLDAKNHLRASPADTRQGAEKAWLSFVCATKDIFADVGVEFNSHRAVDYLSLFAIMCNKKTKPIDASDLRKAFHSAERAHKFHYEGARISDVEACIKDVEAFINEYKSFDRASIKIEFERFVIKDENKKEKTKFADEFLQNFVNKRDTLEIEEYERETEVFIGETLYKNIKYRVY
ncbi:hypothetical protein ACQ4LE_008075 [Meloidogyne hapla]